MPNHKSAEKRDRQNIKRRAINKNNRTKVRSQIKKLRTALTSGDASVSQEMLNPTISLLDKAVNKGILHKNTAARYKSRLTNRVNNLAQ